MKNIPEKIFLVMDEEAPYADNFNNLHGVSWSDERTSENDIEYELKNPDRLKEFAEYCDNEYGLFIPSWVIDEFNRK